MVGEEVGEARVEIAFPGYVFDGVALAEGVAAGV